MSSLFCDAFGCAQLLGAKNSCGGIADAFLIPLA